MLLFLLKKYNSIYCHTIGYDKEIKSYHDKIILIKNILKNHDISIIIDADVIIKENSLINILKKYKRQIIFKSEKFNNFKFIEFIN